MPNAMPSTHVLTLVCIQVLTPCIWPAALTLVTLVVDATPSTHAHRHHAVDGRVEREEGTAL